MIVKDCKLITKKTFQNLFNENNNFSPFIYANICLARNSNASCHYLGNDDDIRVVFSNYKGNVQLWSATNELPKSFYDYADHNNVRTVSAPVISFYANKMKNIHYSKLMMYDKKNIVPNLDDVEVANIKDLNEIAKLLHNEDEFHINKTVEEIEKTLIFRVNNYGCRNFVIRKNNKIICHASTLCETSEIAIIGAVTTQIEYRQRGFGTKIVNELCSVLTQERKKIFLFVHSDVAEKLYKNVGFKQICIWQDFEYVAGE